MSDREIIYKTDRIEVTILFVLFCWGFFWQEGGVFSFKNTLG